jgi:hypothetical protein
VIGPPEPACAGRGPPLRFRSRTEGLSQHPRTVPRARRPARRTMLPLVDFRALRHMPERRSRGSRSFRLRCAPRPGFGTPIAAMTTIPPDTLRRRSVPRLHPSRLSPRRDRNPSRSSLPSWHSPCRFASPPWGACGHGGLQGLDPAAGSFCHSESRRTRRVDAFLGLHPPEHSLHPALLPLCVRGGSPRTRCAV